MTVKEKISSGILIAVVAVLPLIRLSIDDISPARSTWSWLVLLSIALITFFILNYNSVHRKIIYIFSGALTFLMTSAGIELHTAHVIAFLYYVLLLLLAAAVLIASNKKYVLYIALTFIACASLYAQWGVAQFILQHDLGLTKIEESILTINTPGVASYYLHGEKIIRGYGPFAHANILGGVLVLALILLLSYYPKQKLFTYALLGSLSIGLVTSFSRTALVGAFIVAIYVAIRHKRNALFITLTILAAILSPLLMGRSTDTHDVAVHDRIEGVTWAKGIMNVPTILRGLGIGNYEQSLTNYLQKNSIPHYSWDIAPVHSVPIFLIMEFGLLLACILFGVTGYLVYKKNLWVLIALLPSLLFDHYFATQFGAFAWLASCVIILSRVYY